MKKISSAQAVGTSILVELLTEQEASGSALIMSQEPSKQAYVRDIGTLVANAEKDCGLRVGMRVVLNGTYYPLPIKSKEGRTLGVVDLHNIRAVLIED